MADVRLLIQEEGRAARNLVAFNVPMCNNSSDRVIRKPPITPRLPNSSLKRNIKSTTRVRSASTGRDKKSELQARYWAFLFGNLQRAVDGIYQTCEEDENISECKEVILVLENYTKDFHNLIEWFKVKWAYENSPPPLRRTPLAWEVRKTSPCRMFNPKSSSPTCRSPDDPIMENRISSMEQKRDNLNPSENKRMKDNRNVSRKDPNKLAKDKSINLGNKEPEKLTLREKSTLAKASRPPAKAATRANTSVSITRKSLSEINRDSKNSSVNKENRDSERMHSEIKSVNADLRRSSNNLLEMERIRNKANGTLSEILRSENNESNKYQKNVRASGRPSYSALTKTPKVTSPIETPRMIRSKTTLSAREISSVNKARPGSSVMIRRRQTEFRDPNPQEAVDIRGSVEVLTKGSAKSRRTSEDSDGWQTVRSRYRRGSSHSLNMATRFHRPTTATSLPALSTESSSRSKRKSEEVSSENKSEPGETVRVNSENKSDIKMNTNSANEGIELKNECITSNVSCDTNSTSMIAAVFKNEADLLEKKIQLFMAAQAERERIILEEERKTEEADSQRSQQLSDEEASLQRQIQELESTEIDIDTETDETDGEMVLEIEEQEEILQTEGMDDISLEDRYENMLEGMSWAERMDTLAQLQALVARHPGRALELHQKLSSPSRKRSLPEALRRYQAKQACAEHKRQKLLLEKSQRLRELLNKVEDVKKAKNQLTEDKRLRMEMKLKRAEENRSQHLLEVVRKAHDEDSKLKEIAFINELEAQNKRHDFMALCQEQEERLQGIQEERQRRQEEKAAKEAAAEERRRALEAERQLRIQKMRQVRREREERVGKMQLEREKERQELAREKARDREERLSALHAAQLANQEELQKKIAQKQSESARRHVENIEHIRQRALESSILRNEEIPPTLKSYPTSKQCLLCSTQIPNELSLLSHLKGKTHLELVKKMHEGRETSRDDLQRFNITQIRDVTAVAVGVDDQAVKERQKALKRRSRKLKQKMTARGQEWENTKVEGVNFESGNKAKFRRNLKELERLGSCHGKSSWANVAVAGLERCLGEIGRAFSKGCNQDPAVFRALGGLETLSGILQLCITVQGSLQSLPNKSIVSLCRVYKTAICEDAEIAEGVLLSNKILVILELLLQRFEAVAILEDSLQAQETSATTNGNGNVTTAVLQLLCSLIPEVAVEKVALQLRINDITGYLITGGLIDRISRHNRALIETDFFLDQDHESQVLIGAYDLLRRLCVHSKRPHENFNSTHESEVTGDSHLLGCLQSSEVAGTIGSLYATFALAHQKCLSPTPGQNHSGSYGRLLALRGLKLLRTIGQVDLPTLQNLLGAEGTNLQWRLIASHLITRFQREPLAEADISLSPTTPTPITILSELFSVLGYFAVNNIDNQLVLYTAGAGPSVLQHLCTLPFPFYGDPRLAPFTLPTLLAATHQNADATAVLSCEMSYQLLDEYKKSAEGQRHPLIRLMRDSPCK